MRNQAVLSTELDTAVFVLPAMAHGRGRFPVQWDKRRKGTCCYV